MKLEVQRHTLRLKAHAHAAYGTLSERELLAVSVTGEDGVSGYGEAAPLEAYDGVSLDRVQATLERYAPVLEGAQQLNGAQVLDACRRVDDVPPALAAIDMALWDRGGRVRGLPVAALLTDEPVAHVSVNATVSACDRAGVAEQTAEAVREGFSCVKLKVAIGDDAARVAAARAAAGPEVALRLDANGGWDVEEAVRAINALAAAGLELVEEPVHGLERVREVRERVAVRVSIDETAAEHGALGAGVADAVCLKISRCGGIAGLVAAATLVRTSGAEPYIASTFDGPLGVAAGVHAAAALASRGPVPYCGLATLGMFEGIDNPLPARGGQIALPSGPGLGVEPL